MFCSVKKMIFEWLNLTNLSAAVIQIYIIIFLKYLILERNKASPIPI